MSNFAFGTYRISEHNPQHIEALKAAIDSGIEMIDTSSNYLDGSSERAIALAFRDFDDDRKNEVEIVSKYKLTQTLEEQLGLSLDRLELESIDCYLIEGIEEYLSEAVHNNVSRDDRLDDIYARLFDSFLDLELAVQNKKILSYGISSDSFSQKSSSDYFLPFEDLLTIAQNASKEVGNGTHSFTTIELPINILQADGLKCASWAKENELRVLSNRPFNAEYQNKLYRLCDYDESIEYFHHLNELMEVSDNDMLRPLYNLLEQLDESRHKFGWVGNYDSFLYTQMIPHIKKTLEVVDEQNRETMMNFIDLFLQEYRKMVLYECSKNTKLQLKEFFKECYSSMQECSINYLIQRESIDYIIVGMRKPSYVHEILSLKEKS